MIGITGRRSTIVEKFVSSIDSKDICYGTYDTLPKDLDTYLLCAGVLAGKNLQTISDEEALEAFRINFLEVCRFCDEVFSQNKKARICVIGSESGIKGSFDMVYAGMKAALHLYVETKKLTSPDQHLVCIAPVIIEDSGMTQRRSDLSDTLARGSSKKLGRWLTSEEVARIAHFALSEVALCNSVIRVTGGI